MVRSHSRLIFLRSFNISEKRRNRINEQITVPFIKFIDENNELIGDKYPTDKALAYCKNIKLDLVEVVPTVNPPVCKALDFGKFRFQSAKKKQTTKKQQLKEIKLRPGIGDEDYKVKLKKTISFLEGGHKVKISLRFRGREIMHADLGLQIVQKLIDDTIEISQIEKKAAKDGKQVIAVLAPK